MWLVFYSHFLVLLGVGQIPGLDDVALRLVDVLFVLHMPDADAHAVLCEDDVLLAHALRRALADLGEGEVDLVEDPGDAADEGDGDGEGDDLAVWWARAKLLVRLLACRKDDMRALKGRAYRIIEGMVFLMNVGMR